MAMATLKRIRGGAIARAAGNSFEDFFDAKCNGAGIAVTRMPDGCRQVGPKRLIRVKSDFDWVLSFHGKAALIDTKTFGSHNTLRPSDLTPHQVDALYRHWQHDTISGYIVWFRKVDYIGFAWAKLLRDIVETGQSIPHTGLMPLGSFRDFKPLRLFTP